RAADAALFELTHERAFVEARRGLRELLLGDHAGRRLERERLALADGREQALFVVGGARRGGALAVRAVGGGRRLALGFGVFLAGKLLRALFERVARLVLLEPTAELQHL